MSVINDDNDIPYNAQVFTKEHELDKYLQEKEADMLMICEGAYGYNAYRTGNKTVVLCEEEREADEINSREEKGLVGICKYQPSYQLLQSVMRYEKKDRVQKRGSLKVTGVYGFNNTARMMLSLAVVHDKKNFKKKFKDGIIAVSFALNVGYSIENAFGQAVDELALMYGDDSDIVVKFKLIVIRLGQNENLEDILDDFAEESKVEDIMYFAEIFRYAKRSGGDLMAVIKNTAQIIQQKEEVMSEVDTIISGKKMEQRVMSLIPAVIVIYLKVTAKEFIQPLYGNIAGIIIMTVCLAVYVVSDMWAKRIVNIEV